MRQYIIDIMLVVLAINIAIASGPGAPSGCNMYSSVPTRSATTDAFIASVKSWAQTEQRQYGVNASVAIAQAAVESGWGQYAVDNTYFNMRYPSGDPYTTGGVSFGSSGPWCAYASGQDAFLAHGWLITHGSNFTGVNGNHIDCRKDLGNALQLMYDIAYDGYDGGPRADPSVFAGYYNTCVGIINNHNLTQYDIVSNWPPADLSVPIWVVTQNCTDGSNPNGLTIKNSPGGTTIDHLSDGIKLHLIAGPVLASNGLKYYQFDYNDGGRQNGWVGHWQTYQGTNYTYLVPTSPPQFTVGASAGANGAVTPSSYTVNYGNTSDTFTAMPNGGYQVDKWMEGSNVLQTGGPTYTYPNVQTNHSVTVTFKPLQYTINASAGANGSVTPPSYTVNYGNTSGTFTATPNGGYQVDTWMEGSTILQPGGTTYAYPNVTANHNIVVTFKTIPVTTYTITPSADANGSVSPNAPPPVTAGGSITFTASPVSTSYQVDTWSVDNNVRQTGGNTFTLSNIQANHTVQVTFRAIYPLGDLNHDNLVNEDDADLVLQYLAGEKPALDAAIKSLATLVLPNNPPDIRVALWILNHTRRVRGGDVVPKSNPKTATTK